MSPPATTAARARALTAEPIPTGSTGRPNDDQGDGGANLGPDTGRPLMKADGTPFVPEVDDD
ncbi:MAG: hypothetical protein QOD86_99 [Miltoncostaeaceae bacterium]|jgi:hypothetical protein|nr:hypothetical protein [Miltoncostaeaceae bacterium]